MTEQDKPRCETCRFAHINWRAGDEYQRYYGAFQQPETLKREATSVQCRRHAPTKARIENDCDGWPWISGDDWCGEHQPKGPTT